MVHDDFDGGELVRPLASIVTEDKRTSAVLDIIRGVAVGGDNGVGDDVAVVVERGHSGRAGASVGVNAENSLDRLDSTKRIRTAVATKTTLG